jgi:hypothetical protein
VRRLVRSGIDEVTFSIDGATAASYAKYRRRGDFEKAIRNLRTAADEKRSAGRDLPFINWRYILFVHNDSDEEMNRARHLASDMGVDRLCWELTDHPEELFSRRFLPGTPAHASIKHEVWDDNNLGNAIPGATPRARIEVSGSIPGLPLIARAGRPVTIRTTVRQPFSETISRWRDVWPSPRSRRRTAVRTRWFARQSRLRARVAARDAVAIGERERPNDAYRSGAKRAL